MKKTPKKAKSKKPLPKHDQYLMRIGKGERLYKFYYFRPMAGRRENFEYRILTKEKTDGMLEMVSYNFKIVSGVPQKAPHEFEELDLSGFTTIDEQLEFLKQQDKVDTMYIM
jgi:hypothetical protein